jgi:hypothetical protein
MTARNTVRSGVLVDPEWVLQQLGQPGLVLLEVDDQPVYQLGHPPGARLLDWAQDPSKRIDAASLRPGLRGKGECLERNAADDEGKPDADPDEEGAFIGECEPRTRLKTTRVHPLRESGPRHWLVACRPACSNHRIAALCRGEMPAYRCVSMVAFLPKASRAVNDTSAGSRQPSEFPGRRASGHGRSRRSCTKLSPIAASSEHALAEDSPAQPRAGPTRA